MSEEDNSLFEYRGRLKTKVLDLLQIDTLADELFGVTEDSKITLLNKINALVNTLCAHIYEYGNINGNVDETAEAVKATVGDSKTGLLKLYIENFK